MIKLNPPSLSMNTVKRLKKYQDKVNNSGSYNVQVTTAKGLFKQYNTSSNSAFKEIRSSLSKMCIGPRRCNYCEDSTADEVEHIAPKSHYPERVFQWDNYCYACGPCNGPKNNKYAVFRNDQGGAFFEIPPHPETTSEYCPILERPPLGDEILINPRHENPLDYLLLDIAGKFHFSALADPGTKDYTRATYTISILNLNTRADLIKARELAYSNFLSRLIAYEKERDEGALNQHLTAMRQNLQDESHQTVWKEMQRQSNNIPKLSNLFNRIPEALGW